MNSVFWISGGIALTLIGLNLTGLVTLIPVALGFSILVAGIAAFWIGVASARG